MKRISIWGAALLGVMALASAANAAESIAAGQVKGVDAAKKEFVLTDSAGKDFTFKLSEQTIMNRGGRESQSDLAPGDSVNVCYDKGILTWTAKYILIREGDSKNWELTHGKLKGYEGEKRLFTFTNDDGKDMTWSGAFARVFVNHHEAAFDDLKIGDSVLLTVSREGGKTNLLTVMCERKDY